MAIRDLKNFAALANLKNNVLLLDDTFLDDVRRAWDEMLDMGYVEEFLSLVVACVGNLDIVLGCFGMFLDGGMVFPQQQNFAMGSLAQISSGAIRCSFNTRFRTRFRRVLVQIPREVSEGSGADTS